MRVILGDPHLLNIAPYALRPSGAADCLGLAKQHRAPHGRAWDIAGRAGVSTGTDDKAVVHTLDAVGF